MITIPSIELLEKCLFDLTENPGKRNRAIFYLRTLGTKEALHILLKALQNKDDSELIRHEIAYVIGQFQDPEACLVLSSVVQDINDDSMVRHEAAEALGAIGHMDGLETLEKFTSDPVIEVSQTCELAIQLINWKHDKNIKDLEQIKKQEKSPYLSIDPAPADDTCKSTAELREQLLNTNNTMFNRYRAMFSLRNRNTKEAALALAEGFQDKSALFRHEIAYVMGQMENPETIQILINVLENKNEHKMVRHEAAEALGSIGTKECEEILEKFKYDKDIVVKESCDVALDTIDYWST